MATTKTQINSIFDETSDHNSKLKNLRFCVSFGKKLFLRNEIKNSEIICQCFFALD